jgi:hypothetical protein
VDEDTHFLLEGLSLFKRQAVRFGNDRNDVDDLAQLFHDDDINRPERMTRWVDEIQAAVDARVLDVTVAHSGELLAEVRAMLVLDVFDNRIPASGA